MRILIGLLLVLGVGAEEFDYRVLATKKTSTMEKEMNEAAEEGYVFGSAMGGSSAIGGSELIVVMKKPAGTNGATPRKYLVLATTKTSTMEKELQAAGEEGFAFCEQTVFSSTFGRLEVAVILERDPARQAGRIEYKVLATTKTSTMEKELREAGAEGFGLLGMAVGKTVFGGKEVISILARGEK
jgi:hypothetical protein